MVGITARSIATEMVKNQVLKNVPDEEFIHDSVESLSFPSLHHWIME